MKIATYIVGAILVLFGVVLFSDMTGAGVFLILMALCVIGSSVSYESKIKKLTEQLERKTPLEEATEESEKLKKKANDSKKLLKS